MLYRGCSSEVILPALVEANEPKSVYAQNNFVIFFNLRLFTIQWRRNVLPTLSRRFTWRQNPKRWRTLSWKRRSLSWKQQSMRGKTTLSIFSRCSWVVDLVVSKNLMSIWDNKTPIQKKLENIGLFTKDIQKMNKMKDFLEMSIQRSLDLIHDECIHSCGGSPECFDVENLKSKVSETIGELVGKGMNDWNPRFWTHISWFKKVCGMRSDTSKYVVTHIQICADPHPNMCRPTSKYAVTHICASPHPHPENVLFSF